MPLDGDARAFSKSTQLARGKRRHTRQVASPRRWQAIADAKQGPCRVCQAAPPNELHHLIPRSQGGSDTESNIAPLCRGCHQRVEGRDAEACRALVLSLDDSEYAFCVDHGGEGFFERHYGIRYERT